MPCRIHPCLSYLDFREGNCLSHQKSGKTWNFMYKTYGELSTTCHHLEYRPLEIVRFQRAVTSLFFAWFCSNFHWLFSLMNTFIKVNLICGFWFPLRWLITLNHYSVAPIPPPPPPWTVRLKCSVKELLLSHSCTGKVPRGRANSDYALKNNNIGTPEPCRSFVTLHFWHI